MAKKRTGKYTGQPTIDQLLEEGMDAKGEEKAKAARVFFLKKAGIFEKEREMLALYEFDTDYFETLLKDRLAIKARSKALGLNRTQYAKAVRDFYDKKGCLVVKWWKGQKEPTLDAGKLFNWYRNKWISDNPGVDPSPRKVEHDGHWVQIKQTKAAARERHAKWLREAGMA